MNGQFRADLRVRARHDHRDRGPVTNVPACRRELLNRARLTTLK
jgi:hypothetical protein